MSKKKQSRKATSDEIASAIDEQWSVLDDLRTEIGAIGQLLAARDRTGLMLVEHVRRLVNEKQTILRHVSQCPCCFLSLPTRDVSSTKY